MVGQTKPNCSSKRWELGIVDRGTGKEEVGMEPPYLLQPWLLLSVWMNQTLCYSGGHQSHLICWWSLLISIVLISRLDDSSWQMKVCCKLSEKYSWKRDQVPTANLQILVRQHPSAGLGIQRERIGRKREYFMKLSKTGDAGTVFQRAN